MKKAPSRKAKGMPLKPIQEVAQGAGIKKRYLEPCGPDKAKLSLAILKDAKKKKTGKYVLVTSLTPSPFGEGTTVTTIGLSMAFNRLRKKAIACIAQPALGGVLGIKGGGSGAGLSQVLPAESANLYFTGDSHAVQVAHNLCAAHLDNSVFRGNPLNIDTDSISWRRVLDVNDRYLRSITVGLGAKTDGIPRKTGFDATTTSELMSTLALTESVKDLKQRIGRIILAYTKKGRPVTCDDMKITGAMTALLKDAIKPNLLQTSEGTACLMHTGSSGSIALGSSSLIADRIALGHSEYAIAETEFGADLGAEKCFDIKCRQGGLRPSACVLVCTIRSLKMHSGDVDIIAEKPLPRELFSESVSAVERGFPNLEKQIQNIKTFGVPVVLCINRFTTDGEKEINAVIKRAKDLGADYVTTSNVRAEGSQGGVELAHAVMEACALKSTFRYLYPVDLPIKDKIRRIAKTIYGAKEVVFSDQALKKTVLFKKQKLDQLPLCIAKTHFSLSHNPKRKGRPHGFKLPVDDLCVNNGAGYITAFCGGIRTMPGLPRASRGQKINIDDEGRITGLL